MSHDKRDSPMVSAVINYPRETTLFLLAAVGAHAVAACKWSQVPTLADNLDGIKGVAAFYLGAAAAVAMIGGFAGMVVVFAMTQGLKRFAKLRAVGGESLETNWIHPISVRW